MSRPRRYLLAAGVLLLAVLVGLTWQALRGLFKEAESEDAAEVERFQQTALTTPPPVGPDWPQYRGPNRDGVASADQFSTDWEKRPPTLAWKSQCGGGYGSVAVAGGRVYAQDRQGGNERLVCFTASDGTQQWADESPADYSSFHAGYTDGPRATPTIHDGRAYTVGALGRFRCLKLNGDTKPELLWEHDLPREFNADLRAEPLRWGYAGSPLIEGDLVIVPAGGRGGSVAAFDRVTGERRWAVGQAQGAYSSPVVSTFGGVRQVVAMTGDAVVGVGVPDGQKLWEHPWKTAYGVNAASPLIAGDYVFLSSDYGKGCAVLRVEGATVRQVYFRPGAKGLKTWHSSGVHRDGFVYGFDSTVLKCWNLKDGKFADDWDAPGIDKGSVLLVGDTLLVQGGSGGLYLIAADPTECRVIGQAKGLFGRDCWATPAVLDGRIYTRDGANVVCIDARK